MNNSRGNVWWKGANISLLDRSSFDVVLHLWSTKNNSYLDLADSQVIPQRTVEPLLYGIAVQLCRF